MLKEGTSRRQIITAGTLTACGLGLGGPVQAQSVAKDRTLEQQLARLEERYAGSFSVKVNRLDTDGGFEMRSDSILPTASTCKLFVLCEMFRQAEAGMIDLKAPITWKPEHHRGGDGVLRAMIPGQKLSIHNMAVLMITLSDNVATAALVDQVGPANVTRTMQQWGLRDSNLYDGLPGGPAPRGA